MNITYWKRERLGTGELISLSRLERGEGGIRGFMLRNGEWVEEPRIVGCLGWDDNYDRISEEEARELAEQLGGTL